MRRSEIIPGLFVGNREAAARADKKVPDGWTYITVTEYRDRGELPDEPTDSIDIRFTAFDDHARPEFLDAIARRIDESLKVDKKVLVHCVMGCERSPLAICWYLVKSGRFPTIDAAYQHVVARHPPTGRRDHWLKGAVPVPFAIDSDAIATATAPTPTHRPLLGLCMIVKDEAGGIAATLRSFKPYIDRWLVLDTGSTDGTEQIAFDEMKGVPGQVNFGPFGDFSTARNMALGDFEYLFPDCPFVIMPDADDVLHGGEQLRTFLEQNLAAHAALQPPAFHIRMHRSPELDYYLPLVMRTASKNRYKMRVHEHLATIVPPSARLPPEVKLTHNYRPASDLQRRARWARDRELLQQDVVDNPRNARAWFYLAQTYECLGLDTGAIEFYEKHLGIGSFPDEMYEARWRIAKLKAKIGQPEHEVIGAYLAAYEQDPRRAEPLYEIALKHSAKDQHGLAFMYAQHAASLPMPNTTMFCDREVYEYKAAWLVARHAYYVGHKSKDAATLFIGKVSAERCIRAKPTDNAFRANAAFYTPSIRSVFGAKTGEIDFTPEAPYHASNPSVHYDPIGKQWRCIVRTSNYEIVNGKYLTGGVEVQDGHPIITKNVMLELDAGLHTKRAVPMIDQTAINEESGLAVDAIRHTDFPVHGYEDCRLYITTNQKGERHIRASATVCDWADAPAGRGQRELVEISLQWPGLLNKREVDFDYSIVSARRLTSWSQVATQHQKNWMPVVDGQHNPSQPARWIYATEPAVSVVGKDMHPPSSIGRLRGGSQAIWIAPRGMSDRTGYLAIVHDVVWTSSNDRFYLHRFVLFDMNLERVIAMTEPFYFKRLGIEFCAGLALGPDENGHDQLVAGFSVNDSSAHFAVFRPHTVYDALREDYFV